MSTALDAVPDSKRLGPADFDSLDKLVKKWFMDPQPKVVGRIVTPPNFGLENAFFDLMMAAQKLKGTSCRYPTMGECHAELKRQKQASDEKYQSLRKR
jgi:hypothetical protein